jgi:hypothetical protein
MTLFTYLTITYYDKFKNRVIQQGIRSLFQTGNAFSAEEVKPRVPFGDANLFGKQPSIPFE